VTAALVSIHGYGARVLLVFAVVLGVWGTFMYFRKSKVSGGFRSSYVIMAALIPIQGLLGALTLATGHPPHNLLHIVYGVFAVIFVPGAYLYAQGGTSRREAVILAGACWVVAIAFFRGFATGG
jgi:heme A synthase